MTSCFFVSDLHGRGERYRKLFRAVAAERPRALFIGGDILPHVRGGSAARESLESIIIKPLEDLKRDLGSAYPRIFLIPGNDDERIIEEALTAAAAKGLFSYMHEREEPFERWRVLGYAFVPPSPFLLKDWERYDIDRTVLMGNVSPEGGRRSVEVSRDEIKSETIAKDLKRLAGPEDLSSAVILFHAPPYGGSLDQLAPRESTIGGARRAIHAGSVAIRRFIESRAPLLTLHGHVHESARITGSWRENIGRTIAISAAHDGPELALVRFDLESPSGAARELI